MIWTEVHPSSTPSSSRRAAPSQRVWVSSWGWLAASVVCLLLVACGRQEAPSTEASAGSALAPAIQVVDEAPGGPSPADQRATIDARYALAGNPGVDLRQFRVRVESGLATIESSTADTASRERAREIVAAVEGVREVQIVGSAPAAAIEGSADVEDSGSDAELGAEAGGFPSAEALAQLGDPASTIAPPLVVPVAEAVHGGSGAEAVIAEAEEEPAGPAPDERQYTVQPGDNLSGIAEREMGDRGAWRRLYEHNRSVIGSSPERLRDGMVLRIPNARP
jgi:nucleoid-associated protein YgaU